MNTNIQAADDKSQMMTIPDVAALLKCTDRHIFDLRKQKRIPEPIIFGKKRVVRWPKRVIDEWIETGCLALAV